MKGFAKSRYQTAGGALGCAFLLLSLLSGCTKTPEWTLFYYPNVAELAKTPLQTSDINGYFETLAQCQSKAHGLQRLTRSGVSGVDASGAGVYQCGQQCQLNDKSELVCKQLSQ